MKRGGKLLFFVYRLFPSDSAFRYVLKMSNLPDVGREGHRNEQMNLKAKIAELATALLPDESFFLVHVDVSASRIKSKVTVLIDSDAGVKIDECAELSRKLGNQIEELNLIEAAYTLEVSSPGVDYPLTEARQFAKNKSRKLRVQLLDGGERVGMLEEVTEGGITVLVDGKKKEPPVQEVIPYTAIRKAQVLISFKE